MQTPAAPDELSDAQRHAVRLAVAGARPGEVAEALGVDPATVSRWRRLPAFRLALADAQAEADLDTFAELRGLRGLAVAALRDLLAPDVPAPTRLAAARDVLARTGTPSGDGVSVVPGVRVPSHDELRSMTDDELRARLKELGGDPELDEILDDPPRAPVHVRTVGRV